MRACLCAWQRSEPAAFGAGSLSHSQLKMSPTAGFFFFLAGAFFAAFFLVAPFFFPPFFFAI